MPGPPPNPLAARRNPRVGVVVLPAEGYRGRTPKWPLPENPRLTARIRLIREELEALEERELDEDLSRTERTKLTRLRERLAIAEAERDAIVEGEKDLWKKLWRTPQACQWAKLKWDRDVAQYVRHKAAAEVGSLDDSKEARQRGHHLGLTPKGMKDLMWTIATDELAEQRGRAQLSSVATGTDGHGATVVVLAVDDDED
ncbi:hypothetical protein [Nocardioides lianchengensis]|uniref:Uncharacterized protein n=1 Tax=Nocardioides lianchengensis TaxID=1045774 RepID=A0A1G6LR64_9ACTN|nr:hypothetical protein [Nocardioides lianchengensis]NYG12469.1 hypothetical protein [Nocardioides lianchengensis]SDC45740.1 hypothetical protein SAMN05421872_102335 [Nocardioides lianchengensis]